MPINSTQSKLHVHIIITTQIYLEFDENIYLDIYNRQKISIPTKTTHLLFLDIFGRIRKILKVSGEDSFIEAIYGNKIRNFVYSEEKPLCFTWSEVYQNDDDFLAHLANPTVGEYLQGHAELGDGFTIEVYGTVGEKCKEAMNATGLPLKFFESKCGYSRV